MAIYLTDYQMLPVTKTMRAVLDACQLIRQSCQTAHYGIQSLGVTAGWHQKLHNSS